VQVEEVMIHDVVSVPPDLTVAALVHDYILRYAYRGFPVVQNGRVMGVVSLAAVKNVPPEEQQSTRVQEVMLPTNERMLIAADASLADALVKMTQEGEERLLVTSQDRLMGMVTKSGLLRFIQIKQILGT